MGSEQFGTVYSKFGQQLTRAGTVESLITGIFSIPALLIYLKFKNSRSSFRFLFPIQGY
jgi:hypothetical protein